jgi:formate-nitrite transporter family protein
MSAEIVRLKNAVTDQDHVAGPKTAAVTLIEYGNFECLHCGQTYPTIKQIRNLLSSDLRFVFRHFPTVRTHPHSLRAAEAAEAAGAQGKFWEMHDELFTHQTALEDRDLLRYARRIGLDLDRFSREMSENVFLPQIQTAYQQSLFDEHVTGTPTIYLNEIRYTGATDLQTLLEAIKESAPEGRISLPKKASRIRRAVGKLRRGAGG